MTSSHFAGTAVPFWLRRTGAISWRLLAIAALAVLTVWVAVLLGTVTASVLVALVVAATFMPVTERLRSRGWSPTKAAAVVTGVVLLGAVATVVLIAVVLIPQLSGFLAAVDAGIERARELLADASVPLETVAQVQAVVDGIRTWIDTHVSDIVGAVASIVTVAILALFLTFFVLCDGRKAWDWLLQLTTPSKRERLDASGRDALERVGGYLRGTAVLSAARALAYAASMWLLGVPHVIPLAALTLVGGFVPYLGGIISMTVILFVAYGAVGTQGTLILLLLMAVTNILISNLLRPSVYGKSVHLHPAVILIALPAGAAIAGIVGLLAAIPATAFVVAIAGAMIDTLQPEVLPEGRLVSGWVDRLAQWSWRLLAACAVLAIIVFIIAQAPLVVVPVVLALVIASSVAAPMRALRNRGWGAGRAALTVTGGIFLVIVVGILFAGAQIAGPMIDAISSSVAGAVELEDDAAGTLAWVRSLAETYGGALLSAFVSALGAIGAIAVGLVLATLLCFYFLRDGGRGWSAVLRRTSDWRRIALNRAGTRSFEILGAYMFGTAAISAVGAISQLLIMVVLDLPFAVPIAVLSFIAAFIPYIGGMITTGLAFLIAVAYGTPPQIIIMFVYTIVINIVQGNIVTPLVYNRAVNLHPAIVLLAIPAGGAIAGIAGMFLAVPVLAVISATWRTVLAVLGDEPADAPVASAKVSLPPASATEEHAPSLGA